MNEAEYEHEYRRYSKSKERSIYGKNLMQEVERFANAAESIAMDEQFDVIHCHDWLTFKAGMNVKRRTKKPLVVHVHATEFDRTGGNGRNDYVYNIEREGMMMADKVITVSNFTKNMVVNNYGIDPNKIEVVHNAVEFTDYDTEKQRIGANDKIVLFLGRITLQKGPDYFIESACKVLKKMGNVKFVIAGSGDMEYRMIERAAQLGIGDKVLFAGFLQGDDIDRAYKMADVYVMPSVSEPFGITPLESMRNGTPVIISKQSGVSEIVKNCLKVDFWDTDQMANKIIGVLKYKELHDELRDNGSREVMKFNWDVPAQKCMGIYRGIMHG
jgi:glycosyltransferase involved in cell wall biosynthesis